jgi:SAM-dependent methyltransferase
MNKSKTPSKLSWEEAVQWLKSQPDQQDLVRYCFFDDPLLAAAERYHSSSEWIAVKKVLPNSPGAALDLGAGRGIASYAFSRDGWNTTALEPDPSTLVGAGAIRRLALEAKLPIKVIETWGEKLPFADASFDVVHCRQVLHHARDLAQLCREVGRVLKPGGTFIATREHVISVQEDLPEFLRSHTLHRLYGGENAFQLKEYQESITAAGIRITQVLNPYASNINLFPETVESLKARIGRKLHLPSAFVPHFFLKWLGARLNSPGRIYSFIGQKDK